MRSNSENPPGLGFPQASGPASTRPIVLSVDATDEGLSAALEARGRVFAARRSAKTPHDEALLLAVEGLLKRAGLRWEDLDAVAAAAGPGRFTGIRIGMAFAAMAGMTLKIPALALSRLEAAAEKAGVDDALGALPGWKDEVYYQRFRRAKAVGEAKWCAPQDWPGIRAAIEAEGARVSFGATDAADLLPVAWRRLAMKRIPKFEPFYLKPAGYEKPRG